MRILPEALLRPPRLHADLEGRPRHPHQWLKRAGVGRVDDGRGEILRLVYVLREILEVIVVVFFRLRIIPYHSVHVLGPITCAKNNKI